MNELKRRRKEAGVSLDELQAALGAGFSHARLSLSERGLVQLSPFEHKAVLDAIERIGVLRADVRSIVERSQTATVLAGLCSDIRERLQASAA